MLKGWFKRNRRSPISGNNIWWLWRGFYNDKNKRYYFSRDCYFIGSLWELHDKLLFSPILQIWKLRLSKVELSKINLLSGEGRIWTQTDWFCHPGAMYSFEIFSIRSVQLRRLFAAQRCPAKGASGIEMQAVVQLKSWYDMGGKVNICLATTSIKREHFQYFSKSGFGICYSLSSLPSSSPTLLPAITDPIVSP